MAHSEYRDMDICCPGCMGSNDKCDVCDGAGYVCPDCAGAYFVKRYTQDRRPFATRCMACGYDTSEGWEYDAERELSAVSRYIHDWRKGTATSRRVTRQKEIEAIRKETEARPRKAGWKYG